MAKLEIKIYVSAINYSFGDEYLHYLSWERDGYHLRWLYGGYMRASTEMTPMEVAQHLRNWRSLSDGN